MRFEEKRLNELFRDSSSYYTVPEYQRAYEWDTSEKRKRNQVKEFWEDLNEFIDSSSDFPMGNIIVLKKGDGHEVVDGQQRLTTSLILIKSIIERLEELGYKKKANELKDKYIVFQEKDYIRIKFRPQEYDRNFWDDFIVYGKKNRIPETPSQRRIKEAKEFFDKSLRSLSFEKIDKIREKIENSLLGVIELTDKKKASSIFELQNDRGKALTNLDKIKAFFMHQIFVCNGSEEDIKYVYREFQDIYRIINSSNFPDEDDVFLYHVQAHTEFGYNYREITQIKKLVKDKEVSQRIEFIKVFSSELNQSFKAIHSFLNDKQEIVCYLKDLERFRFVFAYPFIIKAYKFFKEDRNKLRKFLEYLEKIVFVHNITFTRADINSRLNKFLKKFERDIEIDSFFCEIFENLSKESYWKDSTVRNVLGGHMYNDLTRYILKRYEIYLRKKAKEGYPEDLICRMDIYKGDEQGRTGWWIEHIAPKTENTEEDSGYENYDEDFINNYLHSIGNLLLASDEHNISLGNERFSTKIASYKKSSMFHHREVEDFVEDGKWTKESIRKRSTRIIEFVLNTWGLERNLSRIKKMEKDKND
jgi:uncharacterized protein with ParB-like and HNH nuclease domain